MQLFEAVFQRHRDRTVLVALIVVSLVLLALPEAAQLDIARLALDRVMLPVDRFTTFMHDYSDVRAENTRLRRMVATMSLERQRLLQFRDERARLRRLAEFKEEQTRRLVAVEVIGREFDRIQTTLVVDKGAEEGLAERMPVFSYSGLAGSITKVFPHSAWVQLLCSKNHPVSCVDKRSRVVGVMEWRHRNMFEVKNVSAVEDVASGDTLLTTGYGGTVPKGYLLGVVTRASAAADGLSLRVDARSTIDFMSLEELFVMTEEIPWDKSLFYDEADTTLMRDVILHAKRRRQGKR